MVEALFKTYFVDGVDLNDHEALVCIAASVGFDWGQVALCLGSATDVHTVRCLESDARVAAVDIVPFFIFNGKVTVAEAHEVDLLLDAMIQATTIEPAPAGE